MTSTSLSYQTLRTEIKIWEREFKEHTGNQPSIQDIKNNPAIAEKYKLYKKLSKRPPPGSLLLLQPKDQPESIPVSTGYNPFSPQKDKTKRPTPNLFGSPTKSASRFPASRTQLLQTPPPPSLSRAHKRLRGDSVSPSPDKRRRVATSQPHFLPFAHPSRSECESLENDDELGHSELDLTSSSFLDDSPIKTSRGSRSFQTLFREAAKPAPPDESDQGSDSESPLLDSKSIFPRTHPKKRLLHDIIRHLPHKEPIRSAAYTKLTSITVDDNEDASTSMSSTTTEAEQPLIPPSPPPPDAYGKHGPGKNKGKSVRGKSGVGTSFGDDSDSSSSEILIKVVRSRPHRGLERERDDPFDDFDTHTSASQHPESMWEEQKPTSDTLQVNLPDSLLETLNLASSPRPYEHREEKDAINRLLYRRNVAHYDSTKGGEVWHVGENDEVDGDDIVKRDRLADDDDEWDAEPVPWEKADL